MYLCIYVFIERKVVLVNLDRCRADPNVMSETGFTSLILAAAGGHLEVVKTLVEKVIF